jgi:hypothetical protein
MEFQPQSSTAAIARFFTRKQAGAGRPGRIEMSYEVSFWHSGHKGDVIPDGEGFTFMPTEHSEGEAIGKPPTNERKPISASHASLRAM